MEYCNNESWGFFPKRYKAKKLTDKEISQRLRKIGFSDFNYFVIKKSVEYIINDCEIVKFNPKSSFDRKIESAILKQGYRGIIDV